MSERIPGTFKHWFDTNFKGIFDNRTMSERGLIIAWLETSPIYPYCRIK